MKNKRFSIIVIPFVTFIFVLNTFAQDSSQQNLPEGVTNLRTLIGHTGWVNSVSFSPDGNTIASGSRDNTIILWDAHTGNHIRTLTGHTRPVESVSFSPDGNTIASGDGFRDNTLRLWNAHTGKHIRTLKGHTAPVLSVSFSPDGNTIASGSGDKTLCLWDTHTGKHIRTLKGHTDPVLSVSFSPDGNTIASGSYDGTLRLWDAHTGNNVRTLKGHTGWVNSVSFSPDGNTLASGGGFRDNTLRLWDAHTGKHVRTLTGHTHWVNSVSFSPDGDTIASGSSDKTLRLWDAHTGKHVRTLIGHTHWVYSVSFSPDGNTIASGSWDGTVLVWDISTDKAQVPTRSVPTTAQPTNTRRAVAHSQTSEHIAKTALASTVLIVMQNADGEKISTGSGFIIGKETIVTNLHVVEGVVRGYVKLVGKDRRHDITRLIAMDTDHDLALISVVGIAAPPLRLASKTVATVGETVYAAGNPLGFLEGTFSDGLVSGIRDLGEGLQVLQISAPISEGSSGGPVLNKQGEVIGVAVASSRTGQNLNFAVPVKYLINLLDKVRN